MPSAHRRFRCPALGLIAAVASAATSAGAAGQAPPMPEDAHVSSRPIHRAVRTTGPIVIDGVLDETAWADAPVVDEFIQVDPEEGRPASELTEARILYDTEALYIGVRLHDRGRGSPALCPWRAG